MQIRLANQSKVLPINRLIQVLVEIEGLRTYVHFEVINIIDDKNPYPILLGIDCSIDNQTIINFKNMILMFEDEELRVVAPLDPLEGQRYIEQVNSEGHDGYLDHIYNITFAMDDYVNPMTDRKLSL